MLIYADYYGRYHATYLKVRSDLDLVAFVTGLIKSFQISKAREDAKVKKIERNVGKHIPEMADPEFLVNGYEDEMGENIKDLEGEGEEGEGNQRAVPNERNERAVPNEQNTGGNQNEEARV